jgi:thiol:disulfide interchange protein
MSNVGYKHIMTDNERPTNEVELGTSEPVAEAPVAADSTTAPTRRNWFVIAVVAAVLLVMIWTGIRKSHQSGSRGPNLHVAKVKGAVAPDFALTDVATGKLVRLSDFKGKAVLLNFWATWCPPCKVEMPGGFRCYVHTLGG